MRRVRLLFLGLSVLAYAPSAAASPADTFERALLAALDQGNLESFRSLLPKVAEVQEDTRSWEVPAEEVRKELEAIQQAAEKGFKRCHTWLQKHGLVAAKSKMVEAHRNGSDYGRFYPWFKVHDRMWILRHGQRRFVIVCPIAQFVRGGKSRFVVAGEPHCWDDAESVRIRWLQKDQIAGHGWNRFTLQARTPGDLMVLLYRRDSIGADGFGVQITARSLRDEAGRARNFEEVFDLLEFRQEDAEVRFDAELKSGNMSSTHSWKVTLPEGVSQRHRTDFSSTDQLAGPGYEAHLLYRTYHLVPDGTRFSFKTLVQWLDLRVGLRRN